MIEALAALVQPWADLYSTSTPVEATVVFVHLAALVVAGGLAIATDRAVLRASPAHSDVHAHVLGEIGAAHRLVVIGLGVLVLTGVLMLFADVAALLPSWIFWIKMGVFALLLLNGFQLRRAATAEFAADDPHAWGKVRVAAVRSSGLWLLLLLLGTLLPMVA